MPRLSIDDIYHRENEECCYCGVPLTDENISIWSCFVSEGESAYQCVVCSEVSSRHLRSCRIENDEFIPTKTEDEIREEMKREGLTVEILKLMEQKSLEEGH